MKNKLFNKFLSVLLVSFIGLTSISSFNHVSAAEFDSSYNNQLVSTSNINKIDYPPVQPSPNNPKTWIGVLTALFAVIGIKNSLSFDNTINVLQNGFADNRTGVFVDSLIKNNPSFNFNKFASDNNVLSGNYTNINPSLIKDLHIDPKLCFDLEKYNTNLNYNGGNKNYYTNNDYSSNDNYSVFNSSTNNINYTYNNQHYNYTVNNMFYNYVTNEYTFNTTNNQNITYINNYNNTTIISPSGVTQKLYYELPDGSNSLNLTEEQAKKGFKTSLNIASYSNGYDDDNLNFLFHFDGNEYDSAYPIGNFTLKAIPNSVDYIDSSNPSFNQAITFSDSFDLSVEGSNYNNFYSFRIYPQINDKWSLKINGVDIGSRVSKIDTKYDYVEWTQESTTNQTIGSSTSTTTNKATSNLNGENQYQYFSIEKVGKSGSSGISCSSINGAGLVGYSSTLDNQGNIHYYCTYRVINDPDSTTSTNGSSTTYNSAQSITGTTSTTQRTYNIINNKLFEDSGTNLLNYNQWNFISIDTSGKVFINGVDTNITVPLDQFKISVTGDSLTYIDELASFKTNRSNTSPSIPYDSNVSYYLPPVYYEDVYTPSQTFKNEYYTLLNSIQSFSSSFLSLNDTFSYLSMDISIIFHPVSRYFYILRGFDIFRTVLYCNFNSSFDSYYLSSSLNDGSSLNSNYSNKFNSNIILNYQINNSFIDLNNNKVSNNSFISSDFNLSDLNFVLTNNYSLSIFSYFSPSNNKELTYYPVVSIDGKIGFYCPDIDSFITTSNLKSDGVKYNVQNVKKSEIKNNMLLIQSLVPINSSKFGGIRPSNPSTGDVYCSVNENGNITSVQQYNGIEWVKVVGSIYNDALGLWVNAVGFNIFLDNWSYQDIDFRADNPDTNILIRFLTSQFNKVTSLLDSIIEKIKGISSDETVINNYQNNYNVDINTNIDNLINTSKDYDKDIDLNSPDYNVDDSILTDINNLAVGSKGIFKALDDSGFSILYLAPLILLLVGLLL